MFKITIDLQRVSTVQKRFLDIGLTSSTDTAMRIMRMRKAFERLAGSFWKTQSNLSPETALPDGCFARLERDVLASTGRMGRPRRGAAILHGLSRPTPLLPPIQIHGQEKRTYRDADPESYLARLYFGRPEARKFSDLAALAVYFDLLKEMRVMWIGPDSDWGAATEALGKETGGFIDWSGVHAPYEHALKRALKPPPMRFH